MPFGNSKQKGTSYLVFFFIGRQTWPLKRKTFQLHIPKYQLRCLVYVIHICVCVYLSLRVWVWSIGFLYKNTRTNCCCISFSLLFFSLDTFRPLPQTARNESVDDGLMCLTCFFILRFSRISKKPTAIATGMVLCWKRWRRSNSSDTSHRRRSSWRATNPLWKRSDRLGLVKFSELHPPTLSSLSVSR